MKRSVTVLVALLGVALGMEVSCCETSIEFPIENGTYLVLDDHEFHVDLGDATVLVGDEAVDFRYTGADGYNYVAHYVVDNWRTSCRQDLVAALIRNDGWEEASYRVELDVDGTPFACEFRATAAKFPDAVDCDPGMQLFLSARHRSRGDVAQLVLEDVGRPTKVYARVIQDHFVLLDRQVMVFPAAASCGGTEILLVT